MSVSSCIAQKCSALLMFADHENQQWYDGYENRGDNTRKPAGLQLSSGTPQGEDDRDGHVKKSKSHIKFGDKTQRKGHSGRTGVAKTKVKRPASPYHISSMTVYQKDGGMGFINCKIEEDNMSEESAADDNESNFSSSDLRAKWFLSTNQWQGFMPLQIHGIDSLCNEDETDIEQQPACADDDADSSEMSSTVSESLEKMKENHSLFYKIACDISISDTDITKNDGNTNVQVSCRPEEEEELLITKSAPDHLTSNAVRSSNQDSSLGLATDADESSLSTVSKVQDSTVETLEKITLDISASPAKDACVYGEFQRQECEDTSGHENQPKVKDTNHGDSAQDADSNQAPDERAKEREEHGCVNEDRKVDQDRSDELTHCGGSSEESKDTVQERGESDSVTPSGSVYKGRGMSRSASFGKARVTVLRTSL